MAPADPTPLGAGAPCPCGSGASYDGCCGPVLSGDRPAATAEALMRSRYTAFAVGDVDHLLATWHPATRPASLDLDDRIRWTRLEVLAVVDGGPDDRRGTVEFAAHHLDAGEPAVLREVSRFRRDGGTWTYVRGRTPPA